MLNLYALTFSFNAVYNGWQMVSQTQIFMDFSTLFFNE